jgi:hypothetical protein
MIPGLNLSFHLPQNLLAAPPRASVNSGQSLGSEPQENNCAVKEIDSTKIIHKGAM